jgi:RNA polymerase sigma-70 factor (ECF subfamily)
MGEERLGELLRTGQPAALEQLVALYGDRLFRSAVLLGGGEELAEELVQETFVQAIRSAAKFRGQSAVFTWLYGILLNVNRKRYRKSFRLIFTDQPPERPEETPANPAWAMDADVVANLVAETLLQLSLKHREVIVLHYYEDMSIDDIATQVRVGSGTVKSRLHYARERLRNLLPEELNHFA